MFSVFRGLLGGSESGAAEGSSSQAPCPMPRIVTATGSLPPSEHQSQHTMRSDPSSSSPSTIAAARDRSSSALQCEGRRLRIVVRGAPKVGKSTLVCRLQGKPPPGAYSPSPGIAAARFQWRRGSVSAAFDAWDVVDRGVPVEPQCTTSGALPSGEAVPKGLPRMPIDATTVDVYGGDCDAAVFVFDRSVRETFAYVQTAVRAVPRHVPIILLSNFSDSPRAVSYAEEAALLRAIAPALSPYTQRVLRSAGALTGAVAHASPTTIPSTAPVISADDSATSDASDKEDANKDKGLEGATHQSVGDTGRLDDDVAPSAAVNGSDSHLPANSGRAPSVAGVPPVLLSASLPCGYGMRPLHTALEAVVAYARARELEERIAVCYALAAAATCDAHQADEEQTYATYARAAMRDGGHDAAAVAQQTPEMAVPAASATEATDVDDAAAAAGPRDEGVGNDGPTLASAKTTASTGGHKMRRPLGFPAPTTPATPSSSSGGVAREDNVLAASPALPPTSAASASCVLTKHAAPPSTRSPQWAGAEDDRAVLDRFFADQPDSSAPPSPTAVNTTAKHK